MRGKILLFLFVCIGVVLASTGGATGAAPSDSASVVITGHVPLWIYDVHVVDVTCDAVEIVWKTNGKSISRVGYDTESRPVFEDYSFQASGDIFQLVYEHTVLIEDLTPDETYYFRVLSVMDRDEAAVSDEYQFTTPEKEDSDNNCWRWRWRHCRGWAWDWGWEGDCSK
ncbi:fibronectin type III domain-containing protein [Methanogenium sp. S4BF]|uniref:fibronectin type III domain-containing protein n=1 Tax=Methanogenium sp. S4BF TaxID=1789226 RepID=UPI002416F449|nr:fibronectin type III domain-containing protein [Methanogenium sp. S4BF]WFN33795.1 fibronectin type III domain-containing protein [Methanogenium sp. S4BF]